MSPTITIQEIKEQIEKKLSIPIEKQRLSLKINEELINEKKICEYNNTNSEKIFMHLTVK